VPKAYTTPDALVQYRSIDAAQWARKQWRGLSVGKSQRTLDMAPLRETSHQKRSTQV